MRSIHKIRTRDQRRHQRHLRVRHKVSGSPERPRLVVFRSSKHIYAQLVDDTRGVTLVGAADRSEGVAVEGDRKSTRLDSSHLVISYAVFCLKKKKRWVVQPASRPRRTHGRAITVTPSDSLRDGFSFW